MVQDQEHDPNEVAEQFLNILRLSLESRSSNEEFSDRLMNLVNNYSNDLSNHFNAQSTLDMMREKAKEITVGYEEIKIDIED